MKAILLIITLAASASCAVPTAVGTDFSEGQIRFGARTAIARSDATVDGSGYVLGNIFALDGGMFLTDQLELGATAELYKSEYDGQANAQLFTGFARYYLQSEGNVRPFVLIGAGLYNAEDGVGDVYRLGAGVSQFISDKTSLEISIEEQFSSYVTDFDVKAESDATTVYLGVNILL